MTKPQPQALIVTGAGINCEEESLRVLHYAGFKAKIVHIVDLLQSPQQLDTAQMFLIPGGFSYGDHAGAAFVFAEQLRRIADRLELFLARDTLMMGICNGCQTLLHLGLFSESKWGFRPNESRHYECRPTRLVSVRDTAFFSKNTVIEVPVAHGEGLLFGGDADEIALRYATETGAPADGLYPQNPNGSQSDCAGLSAYNGRVLALMPHPERAFFRWQAHDFLEKKAKYRVKGQDFNPNELSSAAQIFLNARRYFV